MLELPNLTPRTFKPFILSDSSSDEGSSSSGGPHENENILGPLRFPGPPPDPMTTDMTTLSIVGLRGALRETRCYLRRLRPRMRGFKEKSQPLKAKVFDIAKAWGGWRASKGV